MYVLASVTRDEMDLAVDFFETHEKAFEAMQSSVLDMANCGTLEELEDRLDSDDGEYISKNSACVQSSHLGTIVWSIREVPTQIQKEVA